MKHYHRFGYSEPTPERVEIEAILLAQNDRGFSVQLDEKSQIQHVPKHGVRVKERNGRYAIFDMTERRAINLGLL